MDAVLLLETWQGTVAWLDVFLADVIVGHWKQCACMLFPQSALQALADNEEGQIPFSTCARPHQAQRAAVTINSRNS